MYKFCLYLFGLLSACSGTCDAQPCELHAVYDVKTSKVIFDWNMISSPLKTTYVLLRTIDGKNWSVVVTDKRFQIYSGEDVFDYDEKVTPDNKYYYRLKIIDAANNIIALSNVAEINTNGNKGLWVLYPNPVNDVLHLESKGNEFVKGVINVLIQDMAGKIVTRFRGASIYKTLQIPVSDLARGAYLVQVIIMNEVKLNQKFIKQ